jgi:hypothetical protein
MMMKNKNEKGNKTKFYYDLFEAKNENGMTKEEEIKAKTRRKLRGIIEVVRCYHFQEGDLLRN